MGFFDRFKKSNKENVSTVADNEQKASQLPFDVEYSSPYRDTLQVEFYDKEKDFKRYYDTTRLIVNRQPQNIGGRFVYLCAVSWYGQNDCKLFNKETGQFENFKAKEYKYVLAQINLRLLRIDPNYCNMVMKELLNRQRVERYLERGLQETPEQPCGQYIGGIMEKEGGYCKFFSTIVGQASHNSPIMVAQRNEERARIESIRQKIIADKKAQIEKLQRELESMER